MDQEKARRGNRESETQSLSHRAGLHLIHPLPEQGGIGSGVRGGAKPAFRDQVIAAEGLRQELTSPEITRAVLFFLTWILLPLMAKSSLCSGYHVGHPHNPIYFSFSQSIGPFKNFCVC